MAVKVYSGKSRIQEVPELRFW